MWNVMAAALAFDILYNQAQNNETAWCYPQVEKYKIQNSKQK